MSTSVAVLARRFLRWEFVPEAVLLAGLTAFFLHQNDAATSAFKSGKALAIMAAATTGWLGARLVLARLVRFALARAALFSVAALFALSVVVLPAYDNETVVESFPAAVPVTAPVPTPAAPAGSEAPAAARQLPVATPTTPVTGPGRRSSSTTSSTATTVATVPQTPIPAAATTEPVAAPPPEATAAPEAAPSANGPQRIRSGAFRGVDHRASGVVAVYRQPDGRHVIGLEDIDIQPGPDYDLYVVPGEDREDTKGGIRLGDLRGNRGTQFYEVPDGVDLGDGSWTVLVWCQTFAVPVARATPT